MAYKGAKKATNKIVDKWISKDSEIIITIVITRIIIIVSANTITKSLNKHRQEEGWGVEGGGGGEGVGLEGDTVTYLVTTSA